MIFSGISISALKISGFPKACRSWEEVRGQKAAKKKKQVLLSSEEESLSSSSLSSSALRQLPPPGCRLRSALKECREPPSQQEVKDVGRGGSKAICT